MSTSQLAKIIEREKESLMEDWRQQVLELPAAEHQSDPTLNDHIPLLLGDLADDLQSNSCEAIPKAVANMSGSSHGYQRLRENYDIEEVVAEYSILRGCIHDLATRNEITLEGDPFHILNRVLDGSIGQAVKTYASQQAEEVKRRREEYLSFVVHDLRTPLNSIAMAAQLLQRTTTSGPGDAEDSQKLLKVLRGNVGTLTSLIAQILEENVNLLSEEGTKIERRMFELWGLVENVIHDLAPMNEGGACELSNLVPYDVTVYGDASLLRRVFRNLIANAIKYTPKGKIEVGAMKRAENGAVEFWVKDNGAGIPESRIGHVFEKLETDPARDDGTGLGLAIVETFIKAHNGEIRVESKEGIGSAFHISLPGRDTEDKKGANTKED